MKVWNVCARPTKKAAFEAEFMKWVNADPTRTEKYGNALSLIENAVKDRAEQYNVQQYLSEIFRSSCEMIGYAGQLAPLEDALTGKDSKKVAEIKERALEKYRQLLRQLQLSDRPEGD